MSAVPKDAVPRHDGAVQATSGEFAGWWTWTRDNFEVNNGPFWHREEENGEIRCAFRLEKKHLNGSGAVHGGCLMAFADYCLFALGNKILLDAALSLRRVEQLRTGTELAPGGHRLERDRSHSSRGSFR